MTADQSLNSITAQLVTVNGVDGKQISHISFFATGSSVADGGTTVALLGMGLAGIGAVRRFVKA